MKKTGKPVKTGKVSSLLHVFYVYLNKKTSAEVWAIKILYTTIISAEGPILENSKQRQIIA